MARAKRRVDENEVEEIVLLKLKELGGRKNKLTYNNVYEFNKKIAGNPEYLKEDGGLFSKYGYDFWAGSYKGQDYYGKEKINEIKNSIEVKAVGRDFIPEVQDILILVDTFHKEPELLSKKLVKVFEADKKKITKITKENEELKLKNKKLEQDLADFKKGFATVFLNSNSAYNSLNDVLSVSSLRDGNINAELQNMFKDEYDLFGEKVKNATSGNDKESGVKVTSISEIEVMEKRRKRRQGL